MGDFALGPATRGLDPSSVEPALRSPSAAVLARTIEGDIIPRLLLAHRRLSWSPGCEKGGALDRIDEQRVDAFALMTVRRDVGVLLDQIGALLGRGVALDEIYLDLLAPVARRLGTMWEEDSCSFTDVALGLCRLQQVVHELSSKTPRAGEQNGAARRALFASAPGEQHTFGLIVINEFFRRAGWRTWSECHASQQELLTLVRTRWFELVGLTVSCEENLAHLPDFIMSLRRVSQNRAVGIMVGGRVFMEQPELAIRTGADATAQDGKDAVRKAEALMSQVVSRI